MGSFRHEKRNLEVNLLARCLILQFLQQCTLFFDPQILQFVFLLYFNRYLPSTAQLCRPYKLSSHFYVLPRRSLPLKREALLMQDDLVFLLEEALFGTAIDENGLDLFERSALTVICVLVYA